MIPFWKSRIEAAIEEELRSRLATLRGKSNAELLALPDFSSEDVTVDGVKVIYSVYREKYPDGRLLILLRSDRRSFVWFGGSGTTEGFWAAPDGGRRDAVFEDIADVFS
jgi:hypothetical protein